MLRINDTDGKFLIRLKKIGESWGTGYVEESGKVNKYKKRKPWVPSFF
jgi:hypothetical protein